ncbi:MAG: response regulator [Planctomycetes bacterium]|nr:response regulator [Planctomycetota bacterium]
MRDVRPWRRRVWLLDDEPDILAVVEAQLTPRSIEVTPFSTPGPLLHALENARPDVIIMDLGLPFLDGSEVIERIRANPQTRTLPIVVLSCDRSVGSRVKALHQHVSAFLTKPYDAKDLIAAIERAADAAARPAPPPPPGTPASPAPTPTPRA